jgi:hypothetical protein
MRNAAKDFFWKFPKVEDKAEIANLHLYLSFKEENYFMTD